MPTISKTQILVKAALSGQYDKAGVSKYNHCVRVWQNATSILEHYNVRNPKTRLDVQLVSLLHDVIEDSDITDTDLHVFGYSNAVIDAVLLVTHDETESYHDYIDRLCDSSNVLALMAKLADNIDNNDPKRLEYLDEKFRARLAERYAGVRPKLEAAIEAWWVGQQL